MVGRVVSSGSGRARTSWYSATPMGFSMPERAYSATRRFLRLAEQQADGGLVVRGLDLGIHGGEIEIELAGVFGLEGRGLEFHHHIAFQPGVVEEQVDEKFIAADLKAELAADKGEAGAQFQQKPGDVADEGVFDIALVGFVAEAEKVEEVGVFQRFGSELAHGVRQELRRSW